MTDFSHLDAIHQRLDSARDRLAVCKPRERTYFAHVVTMIEREEAAEYAFLGITPASSADMADDELLAELGA